MPKSVLPLLLVITGSLSLLSCNTATSNNISEHNYLVFKNVQQNTSIKYQLSSLEDKTRQEFGKGDDLSRSVVSNPQHTDLNGGNEVKITWFKPNLREDGSILDSSQIQGYRIYYGNQLGIFDNFIEILDSHTTQYTFNHLETGNYYFTLTVIDVHNHESVFSNVVSKSISR